MLRVWFHTSNPPFTFHGWPLNTKTFKTILFRTSMLKYVILVREILRINLPFKPDPEDMSQCYYCIRGPQDSVYEGGYYIGKLVLSRDHPYKPPTIYMMTPSGRFEPEKSIW